MTPDLQLRVADRARQRRAGSVIVLLLIVIAVIGGGLYLLFDSRHSREAEARAFARDVIQRLAVQHDLNYLHSIVSSESRLHFTRGRDDEFIQQFTWLGVPDPNYQLTGDVVFESYFSSPVGTFKAVLRYPERHATVQMKVSCPAGSWRLDELSLSWERTPEESDARARP